MRAWSAGAEKKQFLFLFVNNRLEEEVPATIPS